MSMTPKRESDKHNSTVNLESQLRDFVKHAAENGRPLGEFEHGLLERLLVIGKLMVDEFLARQGNGDLGETFEHEGRALFRSPEPVTRGLQTVFGTHEFPAYVYRRRKHLNTPIQCRPVDERMGIEPDRYSPMVQEFSMLLCCEQAFHSAVDTFRTFFGQRLSVDSLERVSRKMGRQAGEYLQELPAPKADEEAELLVMTADGKGVPMVRDDARRLRAFEARPERPGNRRMATLAAVYSVSPHVRTPDQIVAALFARPKDDELAAPIPRPKPQHKRVIARLPEVLPDVDPETPVPGDTLALTWAACGVETRRQPKQTVILLMDGQHSLWTTADACLSEVPRSERVEILDLLHAAGYVWRAAKVFCSSRDDQEAFARDRLLQILEGKVNRVIRSLRCLATRRGLSGEKRQEITTVCGYFAAHQERMNYGQYLAAGYPIATGVIEGACRHLVKDRLERSGMRWTQSGAQGLLHLRALRDSGQWNEFRQHRRTVPDKAHALNG